MAYTEIPKSVQHFMEQMTQKCHEANQPRWAENFNAGFANTLLTTVRRYNDGTTFLLTGDIPAMWLRDSTAQFRPYLVIAKDDDDIRSLITGLVKRQFKYINMDPYANAFNETPNNKGHQTDHTEMTPWIWERKYEIDSLCYPVQLAYLLYKQTGETSQFNEDFHEGVKKILSVWETEQHHDQSPYRFKRDTTRLEDTLTNDGKGTPVDYTGMTWSGFRPSDDACQFGYLVPSNMFAVVVLGYIVELYSTLFTDNTMLEQANKLKKEIDAGIKEHAIVENNNGENIFAYEVDGKGHYSIMDDSNVPSLMAAPYLGYLDKNDPLYLSTRKTLLSKENPYFYEGEFAKGIGSSHTPEDYVWPIALAIEGLTTDDKQEKERILNLLVDCDGGTHLMHEGFDVNNPNHFTREWFSWANMMFCELVMDYFDITINAHYN